MQRHAYLIMAHSEYDQLNILLQMLDYEYNDIYIHIDRKNYLPNREFLCKNVTKSNIHIYYEFAVYWGDFSQTACEIFLMEEAFKNKYDYYHLVSGADLPLYSQKIICAYFEANAGKEFVRFYAPSLPAQSSEWIKYFHPLQKYLRSNKQPILDKLFEKITFLLILTQKMLGVNRIKNSKIIFQKGTTWFSITHELVTMVITQKKWIYDTFKCTRSSDEMFLQTILNNSKLVVNRAENTYEIDGLTGLRYIDWNRGKPYIFRKNDYSELLESGFLFARKFSISVDKNIVEAIYQKVLDENLSLK